MKVRNGFVSNSSSSSFIVAVKSVPKLTIGEKKIDLGRIIPGRVVNEDKTREQVLDWINYEYCYIDKTDTFEQDLYDEVSFAEHLVRRHDEGYKIISYSIDYSDETATRLINTMISCDDMIEITSH